jgi:hypothetical protein
MVRRICALVCVVAIHFDVGLEIGSMNCFFLYIEREKGVYYCDKIFNAKA